MKRIVFLRAYRVRRGGHITVRHFFDHSMAHPDLDPYVYFLPGSDVDNDVWASVPRDRLISDFRPQDWDLVFLGGRTWKHLPHDLGRTKVINVVLHVRHANNPSYRKFLSRPAYRIADAEAVRDAIAPLANGPLVVIHEAIDFSLFPSDVPKRPGSVMIYGQKNPGFAEAVAGALRADGVDVTAFNEGVPQPEFAAIMARSEVFVGVPNRTEGFYRPPAEAMACGCAVVCSDAVGSRVHLKPDETCLQPAYADVEGHVAAVRRLLHDGDLRGRLQANGLALARSFSLEAQRAKYFDFLDRYVLADG